MKDGPFDAYTSEQGTYVLDGNGIARIKVLPPRDQLGPRGTGEDKAFARRIAAALNRDEARKGTKLKVVMHPDFAGDLIAAMKRTRARKGRR